MEMFSMVRWSHKQKFYWWLIDLLISTGIRSPLESTVIVWSDPDTCSYSNLPSSLLFQVIRATFLWCSLPNQVRAATKKSAGGLGKPYS